MSDIYTDVHFVIDGTFSNALKNACNLLELPSDDIELFNSLFDNIVAGCVIRSRKKREAHIFINLTNVPLDILKNNFIDKFTETMIHEYLHALIFSMLIDETDIGSETLDWEEDIIYDMGY